MRKLPRALRARSTSSAIPFLVILAVATAAGLAAPASGQTSSGGDALTLALEGFDFREIGPATMGGRVADIGGVESRPSRLRGRPTGGATRVTSGLSRSRATPSRR